MAGGHELMAVVESRPDHLELPVRYNAAVDILDGNLEAGRAKHVAIISADGSQSTYAQIASAANRVGNAFRSLGVEIENRVLMAVLDGPEFAASFFGAIKIGAVPIPVNTNLKPDDYAFFLDDSRAKVAVVSAPLADAFRQIRGQLRHLKHLVVVGEAGTNELSFHHLVSGADDGCNPADTSRDDMCFWLYSSGTTGFPKGVVHLQHDMRVCTELYAKSILGINAEDRTFSVAKLYFAYGLGNALYFPFSVGATTLLLAGPPAPETVLKLVTSLRPTIYYAVPTSYANTLNASDEAWSRADFGSVRVCVSAGEPLSGNILERWKAKTGTEILDGIGSTEACHIFISNRPGDVRPDSSGIMVPGYEARIVDEIGSPVADGEIGNLMISGDSVCASYWNQHERTKNAIQGRWLNTGDKYVRSEDGHFYYQGRSDDMLKVGGIWVSPAEVESVINHYEAVLECAVVGIADDDHLIQPEAFVVPRVRGASSQQLEEELRQHVRSRLAHFKCPRRFHFVEALPKTATGKIQRYRLRDSADRPLGVVETEGAET